MKRIAIVFFVCFACSAGFADTSKVQARFDLGRCAMLEGDYDAAIPIFQEILDENPDMLRIRLELLQTYSLAGKRMAAAKEFKHVLDLNPSDQTRKNAEKYLDSIGGLPKWSFDVFVGYMYDDNVTAGTDDEFIYFYGLPFVLDGLAKQQSDSAIATGVNVSHVVPISDSASWVSLFNFDSIDYFRWNMFDFQTLRGSTGPVWKDGKTIWRLPMVWDYAFLGSDRYSGGIGVRPGFSTFLTEGLFVNSSILFERKQHYFREDRTGYLMGFDLSARKSLPWGLLFDVGYQHWREDAEADTLSNDTDVVYGALFKKLVKDLTVRVASAFSWSDYNKANRAFGPDSREDSRTRFSVSLSKDISKGKELSVGYIRTENDSNLNLHGYERNQVSAQLMFAF